MILDDRWVWSRQHELSDYLPFIVMKLVISLILWLCLHCHRKSASPVENWWNICLGNLRILQPRRGCSECCGIGSVIDTPVFGAISVKPRRQLERAMRVDCEIKFQIYTKCCYSLRDVSRHVMLQFLQAVHDSSVPFFMLVNFLWAAISNRLPQFKKDTNIAPCSLTIDTIYT